MISKATPQFWELYAKLPANIREQADRAFAVWARDVGHISLHFKKLEGTTRCGRCEWVGNIEL